MTLTIEQDREIQLKIAIPGIWTYETYLYVGANTSRFHFWDKIKKTVIRDRPGDVDVIEISASRIKEMMDNPAFKGIRLYHHADICDYAALRQIKHDVVLWSHGPSCIESEARLRATIRNLQLQCKLLVMMCPWGRYPPDEDKESSSDKNHLALTPDFFFQMDCMVSVLGERDTAGSNLLAWSR